MIGFFSFFFSFIGTHVAGIIGSKTYGVAKAVNLIDVK